MCLVVREPESNFALKPAWAADLMPLCHLDTVKSTVKRKSVPYVVLLGACRLT